MKTIRLLNPQKLVFGSGSSVLFLEDMRKSGFKNILIVTAQAIFPLVKPLISDLEKSGITVTLSDSIENEPTVGNFQNIVKLARQKPLEVVVGIGGGSVLDVAKLVAALCNSQQTIQEVFGIGMLSGRSMKLICLPTTSGTGSEVSPNAILFDPQDNLKKGVISPLLVPDRAYVDPGLTRTVPPAVTAATGMDALTHCIEAYANKFAHPMIDLFALEGIKLIGSHLQRAVEQGNDLEAREKMSLGSLYGGLCLGPVNTAAVHALSYPLGSQFHVAHGVSNALLLPYVLEFNVQSAPERYADIARALGEEPAGSDLQTALKGIEKIKRLSIACGIPQKLSEVGVPRMAVAGMAEAALTVTRLLKNNLRDISLSNAQEIYSRAL